MLCPNTCTVADWMENPIVFLAEPDKLRETCENRSFDLASFKTALSQREALAQQATTLFDGAQLRTALSAHGAVTLCSFLRTMGGLHPDAVVKVDGVGTTAYQNQFQELERDLSAWRKDGWRIALLSGGERAASACCAR